MESKRGDDPPCCSFWLAKRHAGYEKAARQQMSTVFLNGMSFDILIGGMSLV